MAVPTPLTTIFTPPSSCLSTIYYSGGGQYQLGCSTECIPSGHNPTLSSSFSSGLCRAESYTVACTSEVAPRLMQSAVLDWKASEASLALAFSVIRTLSCPVSTVKRCIMLSEVAALRWALRIVVKIPFQTMTD